MRELIGIITALISAYIFGSGVMRVVRRVDRQGDARRRALSIAITVFILAAGALGFFVAASYFR